MTKLKMYREMRGMTQSQLADKANVPLHLIRQYEQRVRHINGAAAITAVKLANALHCDVRDLMEDEA